MRVKSFIVVSFCALFFLGCSSAPTLPDGIQKIETVSRSGAELKIPYSKYVLDNGLTVILHQDESDPLVHVDVTYHVGSAREELGKSGFAHFFEHMMFQGSKHVADEQHFKIITESGGTLNGTTNSDRTNYFQTVPKNQLEKVLWLEADRMGFLLEAVTVEKFEIQRATVKNERGQVIDNRPYGRLSERVAQALYPEGHPYSWPVIGWIEDLNRSDVNDLKRFFKRWYGPNNATLTVGGDFEPSQVLQWVNKYYGSIPAGPVVEDAPKPVVSLEADRYISMEDRVHLPLVYLSYPTVYALHQDEPALDLLSEILGGGKTSLFYKNMVESGDAVQASVSHPCRELACEFALYALANPSKGLGLAALEKKIRDSIAEFEQRGVTEADLQKAKIQKEASTLFGLQSVRGKVSNLAYNQTFFGNPDFIQQDIERYNAVTAADVERVYRTYLKDKFAVVMSVVPHGQIELIAKADNWTPTEVEFSDEVSASVEVKPLDIVDDFDRSQIPPSGDIPKSKVPELWQHSFDNGIEVVGTVSDETPTTELLIAFEGGHRVVPAQKAGLAELTALMMAESTKRYTASDMALALEKLGSRIGVFASGTRSYVSVSSLSRNLEPTLALLEERLFNSVFKPEEFDRVKQKALQELLHQTKDPSWVASTVWKRLLFGQQNAQGWPVSGTPETVAALTLEDVQNFYRQQFTGANASMVIVSDLPQQTVTRQFDFLAQWNGEAVALPKLKPFPEVGGPIIYLYDKPESTQSVIRVGKRSMPFDATGRYFQSGLANYPFGGAFNSRLNLNLREDKGYTYGARSGFEGGPELGQFVASADVRTDATAAAVKEFIDEFKRLSADGLTKEELAFTQASITQSEALKYETPRQKARFLGQLQRYELRPDFIEQQQQIISEMTLEKLKTLIDDEFSLDDMIILVVGDMATNEAALKQLGYDVRPISL